MYHGQRAVGRHETDYPGVRKNVRRWTAPPAWSS